MKLIFLYNFAANVLTGDNAIDGIPKTPASSTKIQDILTFSFELLAAICFLIIIIAGLRFILSAGEPGKLNSARQAIIYALVGLAVSLSATVIVKFVIGSL